MISMSRPHTNRLSYLGIALASLYLLWVILMVYGAMDADSKGNFVLLQLGVFPQFIVVDMLSALLGTKLMDGWDWVAVYVCLVPPMLLALYFFGAWVQRLWKAPSGA